MHHGPPDRQQKLQRRIGATVMVLFTIILVGMQFARGQRKHSEKLGMAFASLARADAAGPAERPALWRAAQQEFVHSAAIVSLEPQSVLGMALTDYWLAVPPPTEPTCLPADVTRQGAAERELVVIVRDCLQARRPEQVLAWGQLAGVTRHRGDLAQSIAFAAAWQQARELHRRSQLGNR